MRRRFNPFGCWCRWGPGTLAAQMVLLGGLGSFAGCSDHRSDVLDEVLRQRILAPPGAQPGAPPAAVAPQPADIPGPANETLPQPRRVDPSSAPSEPAPVVEGLPEILALPRALERTAQENPRVLYMQARVEQARAGVEVAFAEFLPTASAKYRYVGGGPSLFALPTQAPPDIPGVVSFTNTTLEHQQTELYLQWLVYDFGRRRGRHEQATLGADIAELQYERAIETAQFNVAAAYFDLLRTLALRRVAEDAIRRAESNLRDARNRLNRGLAIRNDVLRAEVLLGDDQLQLVAAQRAAGVARATLNEAIGGNVSCATAVEDMRQQPAICLPLAQALQLAVDNRREFAAALRSIRSARAARGTAAADFMPRINVGGAANFLGPEDQGKTLLDGGVNIEISLFEGGRRLGRLHQADAEIRAAVAQAQEVCNRIALEVDTAWLEIAEARQRVELARTTLTQATENLRVVHSLFQKGDAIATEVVDAEVVFIRSQQNDAAALYDYQTALARLAYAIGISLDKLLALSECKGQS